MAYNVSNRYKSTIYSGDARHKLKLLFNGVELTDADVYCESLKVTSRILPNGSTRFSLDNFIAKEAELILHDIDTTKIQSPVNISIGTLVDGTYEYVPIGLFVVQDLPTTDKNKTTIKLRDYAVKFDFGYNAKDIIDENGGSATKLQILQDICNKAGVETDITKFYGSNSKIGIYDNTITGRTYISYLAEQAGSIATIDRSGKLIFVQLKDLETVEIPLEIVEKYEDGEKYEISRVVYEDAIRKFEYGDETKDTLFINTANPYIDNEVLTNTLTGTQIETSDSSDNEVVNYKQYGYTKQNNYSGQQLFDVNDISRTLYATADKDGWITINVDNTNGTGWLYANYMTNVSKNIKPNTEYALFFEIKEVSGTGSFVPNGYQDNVKSQFRPNWSKLLTNLSPGVYKISLTSIGEEETAESMLRTLGAFNAGQSGSITFRLSVIEDTSITTDNFVYEPYVGGKASPSPDYPQEIEVGRGKNLWDNNNTTTNIANNEIVKENNGFSYTRVNTGGRYYTYTINAKKGETFTFSKKGETGNVSLYVYKDVVYGTSLKSNSADTLTITFNEDTTALFTIIIASAVNNVKISDIQLEKGSVATSYLPYNTIETKSTGLNKFKAQGLGTPSSNTDFWNGKPNPTIYTQKENGWANIKQSNLTTSHTYYNLAMKSSALDLKPNTQYTYIVEFANVVKNTNADTVSRLALAPDRGGIFTYSKSIPLKQIENGVTLKYLFTTIDNLSSQPLFYPYLNLFNNAIDFDVRFTIIEGDYTNTDIVYEPYKESSIQYHLGDNFLADKDYIQDGVLNKNVRHLRLAIADMNGAEDYPGWRGITQLYKDYPEQNTSLINVSKSVYSNIIEKNRGFGINSLSGDATIWLQKGHFGLTQTQWKEQYPDLVVDIYYEMPQTEQIPLETTGELRTFEPNTIITNDLDSEMEVEYKLNQSQVSQILELNKNIPINSFKTGKIIGNPAIDAYDIIKIIDGDKEFKTLATNDLTYNGVMINTFDTQIGKEAKKENVTLTPEATFKKWAKTEIDNVEAEVRINTGKIETVVDEMGNMYTKGQVNELVANAETGVTNTFSEAGGNNEIRNSGLWFKNTGEDSETNPYEFWEGKANEGSNDKATNYRSILLGKGSFIHDDIEVPNGNYSISFYYRKLISNAVASVVINGKEYPLDSLETKQFYTGEQNSETGEYIVDPIVVSNNYIKIEFKCDALDGVEVYDLMCNKGAVKLAYSQNQNETTTSTVNISKGITITSSAKENTKLKADYDGIRILDGANNPKTKFTDKGAETDELLVRRKATITGLLHQEVDDQTWVTKI